MPTVVIVEHDGKKHELQAESGQSVMAVAVEGSIPGIIGECGGNLACATCHVYVDPPWSMILSPAGSVEREMLGCALYPEPASRLACQVCVSDELDGLIVRLPISQT